MKKNKNNKINKSNLAFILGGILVICLSLHSTIVLYGDDNKMLPKNEELTQDFKENLVELETIGEPVPVAQIVNEGDPNAKTYYLYVNGTDDVAYALRVQRVIYGSESTTFETVDGYTIAVNDCGVVVKEGKDIIAIFSEGKIVKNGFYSLFGDKLTPMSDDDE